MRDKDIKDAFEAVTASDELKKKTVAAALGAVKPVKKKPRLIMALAAFAAVFVLALGGYGMYMQPSAYISVDVNPSVELMLNRANTVVDVQAHNRDGEAILEDLDLKGLYYEDAIDEIMDQEFKLGYLGENAYVVFAVQSNDPAQEQELMTGTQECADAHHGEAQTECMSVSEETREQAHEHGMSAGKYQTYLELQELDPSVTIEEGHHMSMHEMKTKIDECSGNHESENHASGEQQANDHAQEGSGEHDGGNEHGRHHHGSE